VLNSFEQCLDRWYKSNSKKRGPIENIKKYFCRVLLFWQNNLFEFEFFSVSQIIFFVISNKNLRDITTTVIFSNVWTDFQIT